MFEGIRNFFRGNKSGLGNEREQEAKNLQLEYEEHKQPGDKPEVTYVEHDINEKNKVIDYNAEHLNSRLEDYVKDIQQKEAEKTEKKTGGWFGKVSSFFEKHDFLRQTKIWGKVIGGGFATVAGVFGSLGFASVPALALGGRVTLDGIIEAVQYYGYEKGVQRQLQEKKIRRSQNILGMLDERNRLQESKSLENDLMTNLIVNAEREEREIMEKEVQLGKIKENFRKIRFGAGLAFTAATIAYTGIFGLKMGVHSFAETTEKGHSALEYIKSIVMNMTDKHELRCYLDGAHFMTSGAEHLTNQAADAGILYSPITHATGETSHILGGLNVPWASIYGNIAGSIFGLGVQSAHEFQQMKKSKEFSKYAESEMKPAFFTLLKEPKKAFGAPDEIAIATTKEKDKELGFIESINPKNFPKGPNKIIISQGDILTPAPGASETRYRIIEVKNGKVSLEEIDKNGKIKAKTRIEIDNENFYKNHKEKWFKIEDENSLKSGSVSPEEENKEKWNDFLASNGISESKEMLVGQDIFGIPKGSLCKIKIDYTNEQIKFIANQEVKNDNKKFKEEKFYNIKLDDFKKEYEKNKNIFKFGEIKDLSKEEKAENEKEDYIKALEKRKSEGAEIIESIKDWESIKKATWIFKGNNFRVTDKMKGNFVIKPCKANGKILNFGEAGYDNPKTESFENFLNNAKALEYAK